MAVSPFKTGHGIVLQTYQYSNKYLDSDVNTRVKSQSVFLSDTKGAGSYWDIVALSDKTIRLRLVVARVQKSFLDSSGGTTPDIAVYLADQHAGDGSHWLPTKNYGDLDEYYTFKSDTPSGSNRFLCGNPTASKDVSVYLVKDDKALNTRWVVLLTHYTGDSVQTVISAAYPSVPISSCKPNATYGSLEYDRLHSIWKDTTLGDNQMTPIANDFAVCLKAEIYKHSYDSDSPWPNDEGSLCGIMWGSIGGKMCALNFTIDPFQNIIIFDPQNGQKIATDKFTPTFCMV